MRFGDSVRLIGVDQQHEQIIAKLSRELAASSTRSMSARSGDRDRLKSPMTRRNGRAESNSFGTDREAIRRVLDIAAGKDLSRFRQYRSPNEKLRVRRMSVRASVARTADQFGALVIGHWLLVIGYLF